jgi:hypothetical protein
METESFLPVLPLPHAPLQESSRASCLDYYDLFSNIVHFFATFVWLSIARDQDCCLLEERRRETCVCDFWVEHGLPHREQPLIHRTRLHTRSLRGLSARFKILILVDYSIVRCRTDFR